MAQSNGKLAGLTVWRSIAGVAVAAIVALGTQVWNDARIAINVAAQHGDELVLIRQELMGLKGYIDARSADRYTKTEAEADRRYLDLQIQTIIDRLDRIEGKEDR